MAENDQRLHERNDLGQNVQHVIREDVRAEIRALAATATQVQIARKLGMSERTLQRHYLDDWKIGRDEAQITVVEKLFEKAKEGSVNAIWKYLVYIGAIPRGIIPQGSAPPQQGRADLTRLTPAELEIYGRLAAKAEGIDPDSIFVEPIHAE